MSSSASYFKLAIVLKNLAFDHFFHLFGTSAVAFHYKDLSALTYLAILLLCSTKLIALPV